MYRELSISSSVPAPKLNKAFKTGKLSLTADDLKGSGAIIHLGCDCSILCYWFTPNN
ncbi:hypothetical protein PHMEG_00039776 [Phytophthora megakarya]|uniref:Uncharacterized protein n=1 Tax=Phytophthora megakarya TaxID=4795 RepID=A0A225UF59_9STRA|nr:hypothetical protein PHMEG_00039776 [Phytophthora megakarya]